MFVESHVSNVAVLMDSDHKICRIDKEKDDVMCVSLEIMDNWPHLVQNRYQGLGFCKMRFML